MSKFIQAIAAAALAAAAIPAAAPAQQLPGAVVAVVDTNRIFSECTACVAANTQLQAQGQQLQTRAETLRGPLQTEAQAIQQAVQAAQGTPDVALQQRIQAFQTRQQAAQSEIAQGQQTVERNVAYVRQQIGQRLQPIIEQAMQQRGATIVLDHGSALAVNPAIDITDGALATLNQQLPSVNVTAPAPQQPAATTPEGR